MRGALPRMLGAAAPAALLAGLALGGCAGGPSLGGFHLQAGMVVSSSVEVMWRYGDGVDDLKFYALHFAPLRLDVSPGGRYGATSKSDFEALADAYQHVMHDELADRFRIEEESGRQVLTVQATVGDVVRSERLRANAGPFSIGPTGSTGEAVLVMEFRHGDQVLAAVVSRMTGARLDRALHGRLSRLDLERSFRPFAERLRSTMLQTAD